jgi:hypothetical protein
VLPFAPSRVVGRSVRRAARRDDHGLIILAL